MCLRLSFLPSLGEINFPLFVERTVETSKDDITGCVQLRCDRGHNSLGLKQDHAGQGRGVRGSGYTLQGPAKRLLPGCENAVGKLRQKW